MNIVERVRTAREPYRTSKVYEEARAHNALLDAETEIERLRKRVGELEMILINHRLRGCLVEQLTDGEKQ